MNVVAASFLAMVAGWVAPLIGLALWQLVKTGKTTDIVATGFLVGIHAFIAWAVVVLPIMSYFGRRKLFANLRFSWLGWCVLALVIYTAVLVPLYGKDLFIIIWYPAVMGCVAGFVYALLTRKIGETKEPSQPPHPTGDLRPN